MVINPLSTVTPEIARRPPVPERPISKGAPGYRNARVRPKNWLQYILFKCVNIDQSEPSFGLTAIDIAVDIP